jgi:ankyrin repeat protein
MSTPQEIYMNLKDYMNCNNFNEFKKLLEENPGSVYETDVDQWTLLHYAIVYNSERFVELLLKHGSDIYARTRLSNSVLHFVVRGLPATMVLLCLKYVDSRGIDMLNFEGNTPLRTSMDYFNPVVVDILLNLGARLLLVSPHKKNTGPVRYFLSKRHKTQSSALVVLGILRFRCNPVVCRDMRNEIGKRIWETRMDEKWETKEGLEDSDLELRIKKSKQ